MSDDGYVGDGETMPTTPEEALDLLAGFIGSTDTEDREDIDAAMTILDRFIKQVREHGSEDLEWGEPGDCWERIVNDDGDDALAAFAEAHGGLMPDLTDDTHRDAFVDWCKSQGFGRHYGDPHCIWCLQAD